MNALKTFVRIATAASAWGLSWALPAAHAAAVVPLSSGVKWQAYSLEWCSPRRNEAGTEFKEKWGRDCELGTFHKGADGDGVVKYNGVDYRTGNAGAETSLSALAGTRTDKTTDSAVSTLVSLLSGVTGGKFKIEGEGVLTVRVFITDYADNTSYFKVTYKIDRTAPQLALPNTAAISESTAYTHYDPALPRVGIGGSVVRNDTSTAGTSGDGFANPVIASYSTQTVSPRGFPRSNLHAFYFQNTLSWLGASSPFSLNPTYSDTFGSFLKSSASSSVPGGYSGPLISDTNAFELLTTSGNPLSRGSYGSLAMAFSTAQLTDNGDSTGQNTQKIYKLRLYDKTVGPDGSPFSGNYSETAFYAVRDNKKPNMGDNGLAPSERGAMEKLLSFADGETVYDQTAYPSYVPESGGVSRFIAAQPSLPLSYVLNDTGIGSATAPELANAGIDTTGGLKLQIENEANRTVFDDFLVFPNRFVNSGSKPRDFRLVDAGGVNDLVSNGTYRRYSAKYVGAAGVSGACDLVGNCLSPTLDFRVVANVLDRTQSNLSLVPHANARGNGDGRIFANGFDSYKLSYSLKDANGNRVIPVVSEENGNTPIKRIETSVEFHNGLYSDLLRNVGAGSRLAEVSDLETDNDSSVPRSDLNDDGTVTMREKNSNPNGTYALSLASGVPTNGAYPYVSSDAVLRLLSISARGNLVNAPAGMTYPKTGTDRIGYFAPAVTSAGNTGNFVTVDLGGLGETGGFKNVTVDTSRYGKVSFNSATAESFSNLPNRRVSLEFASPYAYGLVGLRLLIDGQYSQHYKKLYKLDTGRAYGEYNVHEKHLVAYDTDKDEQPGVLNYAVRPTGDASRQYAINGGARYTSSDSLTIFPNGNGASSTYVPFDFESAPTNGFSAETLMSAIPGKTYDKAKIRQGFVSAITYRVGTQTIRIPSVGRNIWDASGSSEFGQYDQTRNYFSNSYTVGGDSSSAVPTGLADIVVTGLTNQYNTVTTDTGWSVASILVGQELKRFDLVTSIKRNVALLSAGLKDSGDTSGAKKWCSGGTVDQAFLNAASGPSVNCTIEADGEKISFIRGNAVLNCSGKCSVSSRRSIIVVDGSLSVESNVTTLDSMGNQTGGQFFIGAMADSGLSNLSIDPNDPEPTAANKKGWVFVNPDITNLDAFVFAQGPVVSYKSSENVLYAEQNATDRRLRNQLHIMGSLLSLNNIKGSRNTPPECPYIVENCNPDIAQIFDLIYLRRFQESPLSFYTGNPADTVKVPYHPDGADRAKRSGGMTWTNTTVPAEGLRTVTDPAYRPYPLIIERDTRWNSSPSALFKSVN